MQAGAALGAIRGRDGLVRSQGIARAAVESKLRRNQETSKAKAAAQASSSVLKRVRAIVFVTFHDPSYSKLAYAVNVIAALMTLASIVILMIGSVPTGGCEYDVSLYQLPNCTPPEAWVDKSMPEPCRDEQVEGTRDTYGWIVFESDTTGEVWSSTGQRVCHPAAGERLHETSTALRMLEMVCVIWFSIELVCRTLTCTAIQRFSEFILDPLNWADFLTVLPWYYDLGAELSGGSSDTAFLRVMRTLRLLRVSQLLRFGRANPQARILLSTGVRSKDVIILIFSVVSIFCLVFAAFMYAAEAGDFVSITEFANGSVVDDDGVAIILENSTCSLGECGTNVLPDSSQTTFASIPLAMYWALVTMTTVGYGEMVSMTPIGYVMAVLCILIGTIFLSLPVAIFSAEFEDATREMKRYEKDVLDKQRQKKLEVEYLRKIAVSKGARQWQTLRLAFLQKGGLASLVRRMSPKNTNNIFFNHHSFRQMLLDNIRYEHAALNKEMKAHVSRKNYDLRSHTLKILANSSLVIRGVGGEGLGGVEMNC